MGHLDEVIIQSAKIKPSAFIRQVAGRLLRMSCGKSVYCSKKEGQLVSNSVLQFADIKLHLKREQLEHEPLLIEVYKQHKFGELDEFYDELHTEVGYEALSKCRFSQIELELFNAKQQSAGHIVISFEAFLKHKGYSQKIGGELPANKPQRSPSPVNRSNSIREIMMQNLLSNRMMTISSVVCHHAFLDPEINGKECFLLVRYGKLRSYTKPLKKYKEDLMWTDYLEFLIDDGLRYEFFLMYLTDTKEFVCRCKGQIKYIVFDKTITAHIVNLNDRGRQNYGSLHIKFAEINSSQSKGTAKPQKRIRDCQDKINSALDEFNKYYFDGKYQGHILSPNLREEQLKMLEEQEKQRPLNPEEQLIKQENRKFVQFLQKELIKFDREMEKQDKVRKKPVLPMLPSKPQQTSRTASRNHDSVHYSSVVELPKI